MSYVSGEFRYEWLVCLGDFLFLICIAEVRFLWSVYKVKVFPSKNTWSIWYCCEQPAIICQTNCNFSLCWKVCVRKSAGLPVLPWSCWSWPVIPVSDVMTVTLVESLGFGWWRSMTSLRSCFAAWKADWQSVDHSIFWSFPLFVEKVIGIGSLRKNI